MSDHYSDGRRFSRISNAWILLSSWNDQEEIAALRDQLATARYDAVRAFIQGRDKLCFVCGAKEPCDLKGDPHSPCTFEPTPLELLQANQRLEREKTALAADLAAEKQRHEEHCTEYELQMNAKVRELAACRKQLAVKDARIRDLELGND